jgi:hypothetical protein
MPYYNVVLKITISPFILLLGGYCELNVDEPKATELYG